MWGCGLCKLTSSCHGNVIVNFNAANASHKMKKLLMEKYLQETGARVRKCIFHPSSRDFPPQFACSERDFEFKFYAFSSYFTELWFWLKKSFKKQNLQNEMKFIRVDVTNIRIYHERIQNKAKNIKNKMWLFQFSESFLFCAFLIHLR